MIKNKIYYLLLGIGLGIIITSSMNIVFNKPKKIEYSDEQIKEKARSLGMISIKENIEKNTKTNNEEKEEKSKPEPKQNQKSLSETTNKGYKLIVVDKQDTATTIIQKLKINEIIKSEEEFKEIVVKFNLQRKFRTGTYEIKENSSYKDVLKVLIREEELKNSGFL